MYIDDLNHRLKHIYELRDEKFKLLKLYRKKEGINSTSYKLLRKEVCDHDERIADLKRTIRDLQRKMDRLSEWTEAHKIVFNPSEKGFKKWQKTMREIEKHEERLKRGR